MHWDLRNKSSSNQEKTQSWWSSLGNINRNDSTKTNKYKVGQIVLWLKTTSKKKRGKFNYKWMGPYVVTLVYPNGTVDLMIFDEIIRRLNINKIKPYCQPMEEPIIHSYYVKIPKET
jgi:hypothetical protein